MRKIFLPLAVLLCTALMLSGCSGFGFATGSGNIVTREYDFKDFNKVEVSNAFHFEITQSNSYSVIASTHDNLISRLDITQSNNTLIIRLKPGSYSNADTQAIITMPGLAALEVSGASRGSVKGFKTTDDFEMTISGASRVEMEMEAGRTTLDVSGASKITGQLVARDTELTVSGASRCELTGSAGNTKFDISGASQAITANFQLQSADVEVSGASKATINTDGSLNVNVTGASILEYIGSPTLGKVNVNGASRLTNK